MKVKVLACAMALAAAGLAAQAGVGIQYKGEVKIEGGPQAQSQRQMTPEEKEQMRKMGISMAGAEGYEFLAEADGGKFKMTYLTDFMMFPKGSYMLGDSKAKMAYFVFPEKKQYAEMNLDQMAGLAKSMKITHSNQKVTVTPLPPKLVEGVMCSGKRIELSYDTEATVMGFHSKTHEEQKTDYYTTDKYDVLALFGGRNWQGQGLTTGDEVFDKQIQEKVGFLGFPIQIINYHTANGKDQGKTTVTTKDVKMTPFLPGHFDLPAGYTKTQLGMGQMMQGSGQEGKEGEEGQQNQQKPSLKDILKGLGH
jgi:hypothetical protein